MKKALLLIIFFAVSFSASSEVYPVSTEGMTFTPDTILIQPGDTIVFNLNEFHNAQSVSKETYEADDSTSDGRFITKFGLDTVFTADWEVGTYYYVCKPHAQMGMKGVISVQAVTGIFKKFSSSNNSSSYPNPFSSEITIEVSDVDNILISNSLGDVQLNINVSNGQKNVKIDGSSLLPGTYYYSTMRKGVPVESNKIIKY